VQARKKNKGMRDMGMAFAIVAAIPVVTSVSVLALFLLSSRGGDTGLSTRCDDATPVEKLGTADAGTIIVAKGEVAGVRKLDEGVFLNLGDDYPNQDLAVVIRDSSIENWTMPPEEQYNSREVAFAGELELSGGSLQIEARSPDDLAICQ